jgi:N-acetylglucosamine-6-phosphate deacetylase
MEVIKPFAGILSEKCILVHPSPEKTDSQQVGNSINIRMKIISANRIFTGNEWLYQHEIHVENERIVAIQPVLSIADIQYTEGFICPGFIDLQVYGGGGILFSNHQTVESIQKTYEEHLATGTHFFQITLNCSPKESIWRAIEACQEYLAKGGKGLIGLHLEGPFFNPIRRGAHKELFVQKPTIPFIQEIIDRAKTLPIYMTIAPEMFEEEVLDFIIASPIKLSIGHSDATQEQVQQAFDKGIHRVTHLFNAQSQWQSRALGVVGTTFLNDAWASIIVDGFHCDFQSVRLAKELKGEKLFLITDAVTEDTSGPYYFSKKDHKFTNDQGVLSGSALTMLDAIQNCVNHAGIPLEEAIRMSTVYPAEVANLSHEIGSIEVGKRGAVFWMM